MRAVGRVGARGQHHDAAPGLFHETVDGLALEQAGELAALVTAEHDQAAAELLGRGGDLAIGVAAGAHVGVGAQALCHGTLLQAVDIGLGLVTRLRHPAGHLSGLLGRGDHHAQDMQTRTHTRRQLQGSGLRGLAVFGGVGGQQDVLQLPQGGLGIGHVTLLTE